VSRFFVLSAILHAGNNIKLDLTISPSRDIYADIRGIDIFFRFVLFAFHAFARDSAYEKLLIVAKSVIAAA
jgi:hypothetical protein